MRFISNTLRAMFALVQAIIGYFVVMVGGTLFFIGVVLGLCGIFYVFAGLLALSAVYPWIGIPLLILAVIFSIRCALRLIDGPTPQQPTSVLRGTVLVKSERHSFNYRTRPQNDALVDSADSPSATSTNTPAESGNNGRFTFRK